MTQTGKVPLWEVAVLLFVLGSGCVAKQAHTTGSTGYPPLHPGYGEFNANNVLIGDGEVMRKHYTLMMSPNGTAVLRGVVFAREYRVSSGKGRAVTGHYDGKVELRAYMGDAFLPQAWSALKPRLKPVSGLKVEIRPEELRVEPGKNGTFEVRIDSSNAAPGKYYIYIVAFGEEGWKGWAVVEVVTEKTENG
ncbi:hypothetical protein [Thermococcus sp.]|uniref:hypothetical protein n=1 Tax=Thermococcus sp. TaxID=35749 RepID=UPI00262CFFB1|nr:hypothetical protein [Thermococcus sp.]